MLNLVVETIKKHNIPVHIYQTPGDDIGYILASAWKSAGLIFGMPTYEYKVFPPMAHVIDELLVKKVTNKKVFRYGSYGWVGGAQRDFESKIEKSGWDLLGFYEWQGAPTSKDEETLVKEIDTFCQELIAFTK
jgi:flavorubredoxin